MVAITKRVDLVLLVELHFVLIAGRIALSSVNLGKQEVRSAISRIELDGGLQVRQCLGKFPD